jgi:hypothetical protein
LIKGISSPVSLCSDRGENDSGAMRLGHPEG